MHLDYW